MGLYLCWIYISIPYGWLFSRVREGFYADFFKGWWSLAVSSHQHFNGPIAESLLQALGSVSGVDEPAPAALQNKSKRRNRHSRRKSNVVIRQHCVVVGKEIKKSGLY